MRDKNHPAPAVPVAKCTNGDTWNCKYCNRTNTCKALKDPRNFGHPAPAVPEVLSFDALCKALIGSRVVDAAAIEDADNYDDGVMLERVKALHRRLETAPAVPGGWQPIETAPKDGTDIIVMYMHIDTQVIHAAFWNDYEDAEEDEIGWWSYEYSEVSRIKLDDWMTPTHWMPLPAAPKEK